jgi:hypothetical protein
MCDNDIPGIYNFCDRWCERCGFQDRCLLFRDKRDIERALSQSAPPTGGASIPLDPSTPGSSAELVPARWPMTAPDFDADPSFLTIDWKEIEKDMNRRDALIRADPLRRQADEYLEIVDRLVPTLDRMLDRQGNPRARRACEAAGRLAGALWSRIFHAVCQFHGEEYDHFDRNGWWNGFAKAARVMIQESRGAWVILTEPGRAVADGVPAGLIARLDRLDELLAERFPDAMQFTRPGFDDEDADEEVPMDEN